MSTYALPGVCSDDMFQFMDRIQEIAGQQHAAVPAKLLERRNSGSRIIPPGEFRRQAGQHGAAAWLMLITMFLDFTYASGLNLHPPIRTVLAGCSNDNPAAIVLAPVLKETSDLYIDKWSKALKKLDRMPETKGAWLSSTPLSGGWSGLSSPPESCARIHPC